MAYSLLTLNIHMHQWDEELTLLISDKSLSISELFWAEKAGKFYQLER